MPGIAGIISKAPGARQDAALGRMLKAMMHEGFYTSGQHHDERLGLQAGWVCHKGSFSDCLPVWNETKNAGLIFAGETFQEESVIEALKAGGHQIEGHNASHLVHRYEEKGIGFVDDLNGWFGGLLFDLREERIVLFNDRFGLGRIYIHENDEGLFFASEAKALLRVLPETRQVEPDSLAELISCGCVLRNRTLFRGISLLPPGSRWIIDRGQAIRKEAFFRAETWEQQSPLDEAQYHRELRETILRVLPSYFRGSGPVAMSLTGGLDGRVMMALAKRAPGTLPCYTFGSTYRDSTDVRIAQRVAQACQQPHQVLEVGREFLGQFGALAEKAIYISDGAMDVTGAVELYVNQLARHIAPVRLTGNYGSEILRGSVAFKPRPASPGLFEDGFAGMIERSGQTYASEVGGHPLSFVAFKQVPWHHYARLAVEQSQLTMRSPFLDNEIVKLLYRAPAHLNGSAEPLLRLIDEANAALGAIPTDRGLLRDPIPGVTRALHAYEEFTFKAEYAYDYGMPQWLAAVDHVLAPMHLERLFLGRHKFYHFRPWYRDELGQYVRDVLLDPRTRSRSYLRGDFIEEMVKDHTSGRRNYTREIHKILSCELIHRQLIEQNASN